MSDNTETTVAKPSDIKDVLLNSQDILDAAVATITSTRETQNTLEYNIQTTDKKIATHNNDAESHPDIRVALEDMPPVITDPVISGVNHIETGTEGSWSLQAEPSPLYATTVKVTKFNVYNKSGALIATVPAENNQGTFTYTFTGERNEQTYFEVQALAAVGDTQDAYKSKRSKWDFTITHHLPPDLSEMSCTLPQNITQGHTYTFRIGNVIDLDGDLENITISCKDVHLTFNETTIQVNTDYTLTVDADYNGPLDIEVEFTAHDAWGLSSSRTITLHLNALPVSTGFTHTFPTLPNANTTYHFAVNGITDPDNDTSEIRCALSCDNVNVVFPKASDIKLGEDIVVQIGEIAQAATFTITCTFRDPDDGKVVTTIPVTMNTLPNTSAFVATQATRHKPGSDVQISFAGATDADNQTVVYEIVNTNPVLTFSKTTNIAANEAVTMNVLETAIHGQTYNITVNAVDQSNGKTPVTVGIIINSLPVVTTLVTTLPTYVAPGKLITGNFTGATDVDGQDLTYTITSDNPNVILANATNIAAGANISLTPPTEEQLARGQSFNLIATVSDGLETVSKTFTFIQNQLPQATDVTTTLPADMNGGAENQLTFTISAGTDPDNNTFTYNLEEISEGLTISKTTGIKPGETLTIKSVKVPAPIVKSFKIRVVDQVGELSPDTKLVSVTVHEIYRTDTPVITSPVNNAELEYEDGVDMAWTAIASIVDTRQ